MDIFTLQMTKEDMNRANAEMHNVRESSLMAIVMTILGAGLVAIVCALSFTEETISTEGMVFLATSLAVGIGALVCAVIMVVNAIKDFRRATRRMDTVSLNLYRAEQRLLNKKA